MSPTGTRQYRAKCVCDWPDECNGAGVQVCEGCGGDACVCRCGGVRDCLGCGACEHDPDCTCDACVDEVLVDDDGVWTRP